MLDFLQFRFVSGPTEGAEDIGYVFMALVCSYHERSNAIVYGSIRVGTILKEQTDYIRRGLSNHNVHQQRRAVVVFGVNVGTVINQYPRDFCIAITSGPA